MMQPRYQIFLTIAILLTGFWSLEAQVLNGNLTLRTQSEVNAFDFTEISSTLYINSQGLEHDRISDLNPLSKLENVKVHFIITDTDLPNLNGLDNLSQIGNWLQIENNPQLQNLDGLSSLNSVRQH